MMKKLNQRPVPPDCLRRLHAEREALETQRGQLEKAADDYGSLESLDFAFTVKIS
jgi:hypothetical protein